MNTFKVGDQVTWTSQSGGYSKTKVGTIVQIVDPRTRPDIDNPVVSKWGSPRFRESYVVQVGKKLYWPVASLLKKV